MSNDQQYVNVESAARSTGIPARTIRHWIKTGKLTATAERRGKRVKLGDVMALAARTGRQIGNDSGNQVTPITAANMTTTEATYVLSPAVDEQRLKAQFELISESTVRPLIELNKRQQARISELERNTGRLEAELEQARQDCDALQARVSVLEAVHVSSATIAETAPQVATRRVWWRAWDAFVLVGTVQQSITAALVVALWVLFVLDRGGSIAWIVASLFISVPLAIVLPLWLWWRRAGQYMSPVRRRRELTVMSATFLTCGLAAFGTMYLMSR